MKKVMVFGTFDILHLGHINLFKQAKKLGDYLVVVVSRDVSAEKIKKIKLVYSEKERLSFLQELKIVDEAILGDKKDYYKVIKAEKPDIIALGYDQQVNTENLSVKLLNFGLKVKVVRLKSYKKNNFKSGIIKNKLEKIL
ncbi:MAG: adenylyltransferase/cytidyltransferase family protein [Candidatus Magasanikbacteria bacterium]